jgi:cytochrome P450
MTRISYLKPAKLTSDYRFSGRWPWAVEDALHKYGPIVRIAPHELAFFTPQAFIGTSDYRSSSRILCSRVADIYSPHFKNIEDFVKTNFQNRGRDLGGLIWEEDPVRHRNVARKISPAFSSRFMRNLEPIVHKHMDYFVTRMEELGANSAGVPLVKWTNWLAMDMSADLAWNEKMHQMRDSIAPLPRLDCCFLFIILTYVYIEGFGAPRRTSQF